MTDGSGYCSWGDDGRHYAVTLFSTAGGLARELEDVAPAPGRGTVLVAYRDDETGAVTFRSTTDRPLPLALVHRFVAGAADELLDPDVARTGPVAVLTSRLRTGTRWTLSVGRDGRVDGELVTDGLLARVQVPADDVGGLPAFVADLAERFPGWAGPIRWSSLEGHLEVVARWANGGRVELDIVLAPHLDRRWQAQARLVVDAGTQMQQWASDLAAALDGGSSAPPR